MIIYMGNLRARKEIVNEGGTHALFVPKPLIDWCNAADKNYERRVHMDAGGFLTYTYMVAEKVFADRNKWG